MTMTHRLFIVCVLWGCWISPVFAQTEKFANNPNGGAQATLAATITSGQDTLVVSSATLFPSAGIFTILIDVEYLLCTSVSGTTFTCSRGSESSTPAAHSAGANVYHVVTDRSLRNNPLALTTAGDLPYLNGSFAQARLAIGASGTLLHVAGTGLPAWTNQITFTDNVRQTFNPGATVAGLNVGAVTTDPSAPANGDIWYDSALDVFVVRAGGVNHTLGSLAGALTAPGTLAFPTRATATVDSATTFAVTSTSMVLACTGSETIATITGGTPGMIMFLENTDTDCTITDDDAATAANGVDLRGTTSNSVGAANNLLMLYHNGTYWIQPQ